MTIKLNLTFFVAAAILVSCSSPKLRGGEGLTVVAASELPPPQGFNADNLGFRIGAYDKLLIDVYGIEDLTKREVQVGADGRINFPLAGELVAAGRTPAELAQVIAERLRAAHIRSPQVSVNFEETLSQTVTVDGEVKEPGTYPILGKMTLMRAVARARGTSEFAALNRVVVFREVAGKRMAALYDLRAIRQGYYADPAVYADDVVVVGESRSRRLFSSVIQGSGLLTAPLIAVLQ